MDMLYVLLILNSVKGLRQQSCKEFAVNEVAYSKRELINWNYISCLHGMSLEKCALECLLVKRCKSFNHIESHENQFGTMCELHLNLVNQNEFDSSSFVDNMLSTYVEIRNWPKAVAGTCASSPCAENQRCLPTTPYRCIDIDCGIPPVLHVEDADTNMYPLPTTASLGSLVFYKCHDKAKSVGLDFTGFRCSFQALKVCNSDSTWTLNILKCRKGLRKKY